MNSTRPLLISVHLPKTAGTSFQDSLRAVYGDRLTLRYDERPLHRSRRDRIGRVLRQGIGHAITGLADNEVECIHGHFLPVAYRHVRGRKPVRFVTWFRNPVDRLVSHYHYWFRNYNPEQAGALHRQVVEENWSLEAFVLASPLQNLYSTFLWRFPLEAFDFVGITESYSDDLKYFSEHVLKVPMPEAHRNSNPDGTASAYALDDELRRKIEEFHADDMALYAKALELREARQTPL